MATADLNDIIQESLEDAELPLEEPDLEASPSDDVPELAPEPQTTDSSEAIEDPEPEATESIEVTSPAAKAEDKKVDDFEKKYGVPALSATGRENRLPHSRVKTLVTKAEKLAKEATTAEYAPKLSQAETKVKEYEAKLADYDARWTKVAEYEQTLLTDAPRFLTELAKLPQYQAYLAPLFQNPQEQAQKAPETTNAAQVDEGMPMPADGLNYTQDELNKLLEWNASRAEQRALAKAEEAFTKRFGPIEQSYQAHQRIQETLPKVQAQITEARKWPQFNENEADIVAALQSDQSLSLEAAYNRVVVPKLVGAQDTAKVDRAQLEKEIREKVLKELKTAPRATSTTTGAATRPNAQTRPAGNQNLEDVIKESLKASGLR